MRDTSEELAGLTYHATVEIIKKVTDAITEILKAIILKKTQNTDKAKAGRNTIKKLLTGDKNLNAPVSLDAQDIKRFKQLSKEYQVPIAVLKGKNGYRGFFREEDLAKVSEMMKEMMKEKTEEKKDAVKEIIFEIFGSSKIEVLVCKWR